MYVGTFSRVYGPMCYYVAIGAWSVCCSFSSIRNIGSFIWGLVESLESDTLYEVFVYSLEYGSKYVSVSIVS